MTTWPASAPFVKQHAALAFLECDLIGVAGPCALIRSAQADVDVVGVEICSILVTPKQLPLAHLEHQPLGVAATCFAVGAAHKFLTRAGEEHEQHDDERKVESVLWLVRCVRLRGACLSSVCDFRLDV